MAIAIITAVTFLTVPFYPESPRFLYGKDRFHEGRKILKEFAKGTGTNLSDEFLDEFESGMRLDKSAGDTALQSQTQFSIADLFRDRRMGMVAINIGVAFMFRILIAKL